MNTINLKSVCKISDDIIDYIFKEEDRLKTGIDLTYIILPFNTKNIYADAAYTYDLFTNDINLFHMEKSKQFYYVFLYELSFKISATQLLTNDESIDIHKKFVTDHIIYLTYLSEELKDMVD